MADYMVSRAAPRLLRYTSSVAGGATVSLGTFEGGGNAGLLILAKGDQSFTVRVFNQAEEDGVDFGSEDYPVTSSAPAVIYHDMCGRAEVRIVNGGSTLNPDVRIYPRSQS